MVSEVVARSRSRALSDSTITLYPRFVAFLIIGPFLLTSTVSLVNISPVFTLAEHPTNLSHSGPGSPLVFSLVRHITTLTIFFPLMTKGYGPVMYQCSSYPLLPLWNYSRLSIPNGIEEHLDPSSLHITCLNLLHLFPIFRYFFSCRYIYEYRQERDLVSKPSHFFELIQVLCPDDSFILWKRKLRMSLNLLRQDDCRQIFVRCSRGYNYIQRRFL